MDDGMISKVDDPSHKQKAIYSLTERSIALVPVFAQLGAWGRRFMPASPELSIRAQLLEEGGPAMWEAFMEELRETHLGIPVTQKGPSVADQLQSAFEKMMSRRQRAARKKS
jgi:hypothetical protein